VAQTVIYTDDISGEPDAKPVTFGWDEVWWTLDLAEKNRDKLEKALAPFLEKAHPANIAAPKAEAPARRRQSTRVSADDGEKVDYSSIEHAGRPHRGKTTDAEKVTVRDNFDAIQKRLADEGRDMLDPADPKTIARYGLDQPNSRGEVVASK